MWTYAPDLDERTPNILLLGSGKVVPTNNGGLRQLYTVNSTAGTQPGYPALAAACVGARYLLRADGTDRLFAGSGTKLYEANQTVAYAWTDVSRGGNYSGVTQWSFDCYNDTMLAFSSQGTRHEVQASAGAVGTAFANLTNAPKAGIGWVQDNAIYLLNYDDGTAKPNGWIRSDTGGITSWTPGTGECVSGTFTETPGEMTAGIKQGAGSVVFKDRGMWRGQYVGLPEVVRWEMITPSVGCLGPLAVVNIEDTLFFADSQGFWKYDGSRPQLLSQGLNSEWRSYVAGGSAGADISLGIDDQNNLIYIYCGRSSGAFLATYAYNYVTGAFSPRSALDYYTTAYATVEAVCNGPFNKIHSMPGMVASNQQANAYIFSGSDHKMRLVHATQFNEGATYSSVIIPSRWGESKRSATVTRIHHWFRNVSSSNGDGSVSFGCLLSGKRHPFQSGAMGGGTNLSIDTANAWVDTRANGFWFGFQNTFTLTSPGVMVTGPTINFEWMGFEPEYADGVRGKN